MKYRIKYILFLLSLVLAENVWSAPPSLRARLDSASMLMGTIQNLHLELEKDSNAPGEFPQLKPTSTDAMFVTVLGDTIELRIDRAVADTTALGSGRHKISITVPIQVFDSGTYRLPKFIYVSGADTARSSQLDLTVRPVKVTADAEIAPDAEPQMPDTTWWQKFTDKLPDFVYYYWWLILIFIAALSGVWWLWKRYRKEGVILRKKPEPTPYEIAIRGLKALKKAQLWEKGEEREYFTRLTEILRNYLAGRFGINAMEMTSEQILDTLSKQEDVKTQKDYVRQILNIADFVKFAQFRPLPDDNIEAFTNAVRFVEETKPEEPIHDETEVSSQDVTKKNNSKEGGEK